MEVDDVNGIYNGLSATVGLETVGHVGDGDEDTEGSELRLCSFDLGSEGVGGQDVVKQGLGTELNGPSDELGLGVALESREKSVPAGFPGVITVKAELERVKGRLNTYCR